MKVARIAYANTEPFFHFWDSSTFELQPGSPKALAEAARRGDVIAGPLPLVETWDLEDQFEPLGNFCIAAREQCRSVFVLSKVPFSELDHVQIGVTRESASSVKLFETLVHVKYGNDVRVRRGLQLTDVAWLVIGDQALQLTASATAQAWPHVTDLATEWWNWKKKPFVFARWVVRKDLAPAARAELVSTLEQSLERGMKEIPAIASVIAPRLGIAPAYVQTYLNGIVYRMDAEAEASAAHFRELTREGVLDAARSAAAH